MNDEELAGVVLFCLFTLKMIVSTVAHIQRLYPGPISTWSLHQYWSSAKTSSSTAPMTMEPGLHISGSKVESHWPMWRGSCCRLTRSSWPSHGCWWQMMTSTAAQWRILWAIWQVCLSDWPSTVSDSVSVIGCSATRSWTHHTKHSDIYTKCPGKPSKGCWGISAWTKVVDRP